MLEKIITNLVIWLVTPEFLSGIWNIIVAGRLNFASFQKIAKNIGVFLATTGVYRQITMLFIPAVIVDNMTMFVMTVLNVLQPLIMYYVKILYKVSSGIIISGVAFFFFCLASLLPFIGRMIIIIRNVKQKIFYFSQRFFLTLTSLVVEYRCRIQEREERFV